MEIIEEPVSVDKTKIEIIATYHVIWEMEKSFKPFTEGKFIKNCVLKVNILCPDLIAH